MRPSSPAVVVRDRTLDDDSRPDWADLWRALAAETAASNNPAPTIAVEPDAGCVLMPLDPEDDSST